MNKLEEKMVKALKNGKNFSKDNTVVTTSILNTKNRSAIRKLVYLHGHLIAKFYEDNTSFNLKINDCGFQSRTTKSRLNAVLEWYSDYFKRNVGGLYCERYIVFQEKGEWYIECFGEVFNFDNLKDDDGWIDVNYHQWTKQYDYQLECEGV